MPHGSGMFFLEEFGIRGAAAFTDFLLDRCVELVCPLEYRIAAGITRAGSEKQGFESFHCRPPDEQLVSLLRIDEVF